MRFHFIIGSTMSFASVFLLLVLLVSALDPVVAHALSADFSGLVDI
jgi:hypothetical protein